MWGEHPESTKEHPILYRFERGFNSPIPTLSWSVIVGEVSKIAANHNLVPRGELKILKEQGHSTQQHSITPKNKSKRDSGSIVDQLNLRIEDIYTPNRETARINDGWLCSHPVHGSTTGKNLHFNTRDNVWYCHRCGAGGGPLELLAVVQGHIDCSEAGRGCIDAETFRKCLNDLRELGYDIGAFGDNCTAAKVKATETERDNQTDTDTSELCKKALSLLQQPGNAFLKEQMQLLDKYHYGDSDVKLRLLRSNTRAFFSAESGLITNDVTAFSGAGKSWLMYLTSQLYPEEHVERIESVSDKALYYYTRRENEVASEDGKTKVVQEFDETAFAYKIVFIAEAADTNGCVALKALSDPVEDYNQGHWTVIDGKLVKLGFRGPRTIVKASVDGVGDEGGQTRRRSIQNKLQGTTDEVNREKLAVVNKNYYESNKITQDVNLELIRSCYTLLIEAGKSFKQSNDKLCA